MSSTSTGVCAIEGQIWWVRCSSPSCCFGHGTSSASISPPSLALTPTFSVSLFTTSISLFLVFLREKSHHLPLCHLQLNLLSIRQSRCHSRSHYCLIHLSCKVCCYSSVTNQIVLKVQAVSQQIVTWPYHWLLKKDLNCFYLFECVPESPWILNILSPFFFFFFAPCRRPLNLPAQNPYMWTLNTKIIPLPRAQCPLRTPGVLCLKPEEARPKDWQTTASFSISTEAHRSSPQSLPHHH